MMELSAALCSAAGVWLTARRRLTGWPISLLATALYGWVFFQSRLYADMVLQGIFALAILYGWKLWAEEAGQAKGRQGGCLRALFRRQTPPPCPVATDNQPPPPAPEALLPARTLPLRRALLEAACFLLLSLCWIEALRRWSDDPTPLLDGGLSGASLLAQLWTARRHRISWLLWAGIDVVYTGLFLSRDLAITALLYGGYAILGLYGYWMWKK